MTRNSNSESTPAKDTAVWYALSVDECTRRLEVDPATGLGTDESAQRLQKYGHNELAEAKKESAIKAFLRQYHSLMQIVLSAMTLVSIIIHDYSTATLLFLITLFNAVLGLMQESKAHKSMEALKQMLISEARVKRNGEVISIAAAQVVPGDIVLIREGDRIPADGRLISVATLEVEESSLTGESVPVLKNSDTIALAEVPLGDRTNMVFMNTNVTRGRAEMVVTETSMSTQVGHIAKMLRETKAMPTPLTKQIDQLIRIILTIAAATFVTVLALGLARGNSFDSLFRFGVALAVGSIPDALPAVVTTVLSLGTVAMARKYAIIKRLSSVETLGSTSAICSDKTGTLTMNQMTVTTLVLPGASYHVTGHGYSTEGDIKRVAGEGATDLDSSRWNSGRCVW